MTQHLEEALKAIESEIASLEDKIREKKSLIPGIRYAMSLKNDTPFKHKMPVQEQHVFHERAYNQQAQEDTEYTVLKGKKSHIILSAVYHYPGLTTSQLRDKLLETDVFKGAKFEGSLRNTLSTAVKRHALARSSEGSYTMTEQGKNMLFRIGVHPLENGQRNSEEKVATLSSDESELDSLDIDDLI